VAGLPHDAVSTVLADVVVERLRALHFSDESGPRLSRQDLAGIHDQQPIAEDHFALLVDRSDAVAVAIERDSQFGAILLHGGDQMRQILGNGGVGVMIRKAAVHVEEQLRGLDVQFSRDPFHDRAGRAIARVEHDFDAAVEMKLRGDLFHIGRHHIGGLFGARAAQEVAFLDQAPDFLNLFAKNRGRARDHFEAVVFRRIVTTGNHHGAVGFQVKSGIVKHGSRNDPDIRHLTSTRFEPADQRVPQTIGAQAAIAPKVDVPAVVTL
jgi:hypothetical protein